MKLKHLLKLCLVFAIIICSSHAFALGKPFRFGAKIGVPNVVSINAEIITPLFGNRFGVMGDFSDFSLSIEGVSLDFSYWELAGNMYIFSKGRGPYIGFSYMNMKADLGYDDLSSLDKTLSGGTASAPISLKSFSLKLGAKLGGLFYFRPEIGYLFTTLQNELEITVDFPAHSFSETQIEEIPSALTGSFIFNIGFGFAF